MSMDASDYPTDEDFEESVEDGISDPTSISEKFCQKPKKEKVSQKSPLPQKGLQKSPYLNSMNLSSRRSSSGARRTSKVSVGDTRGEVGGGAASARLTSCSNGHDVSQLLKSDCGGSPKFRKQNFRTFKHLHLTTNGFNLNASDYRDKEDMYDEIMHLKKSLQAQKSDNQHIKAKLRRLEEDNAKREKQIAELLDPLKGSEYYRTLADKKKDGSGVINGLKQRILKLEQQCREKENALSKLQRDLRTSNIEELRIRVEAYREEIQRLGKLLNTAEKSNRAESKCSQRQQKALNSTVHRLSENLKQLERENATLREELDTNSPVGGLKGYREWSKQRLLRRLLEIERRLEDSKRHTQTSKCSSRLDREVQTLSSETPRITMATKKMVSVGTNTEESDEVSDLSLGFCQIEEENAKLQETLARRDCELMQLKTERGDAEKEMEQWKTEQTKMLDKERELHRHELDLLWDRIQMLEDRNKLAHADCCSAQPKRAESCETVHRRPSQKEEKGDMGFTEKEMQGDFHINAATKERDKAALIIQKNWRCHRRKDLVRLQSAFRSHLQRTAQRNVLVNGALQKAVKSTNQKDVVNSVGGELDTVALTIVQSAFRGHLTHNKLAIQSSGFDVPSPMENNPETSAPKRTSQTEFPSTQVIDGVVESDDSDDIIMSPSRPQRNREVLMT